MPFPRFKDIHISKRTKITLSIVFILILSYLAIATNYDSSNLFHHFAKDYHQLQADAFRLGSIELDKNITCLLDLSVIGDRKYLTHGFLPALIYSVLDAIYSLFTGTIFPKVLLFFLFISLHIIFLFYIFRLFFKSKYLLPIVVISIYLFSYPFWIFINANIETYQISILYGSVFFLIGLLFYFNIFRDRSCSKFFILASLFLGFACLSKLTYFIYFFLLSFPIILGKFDNKRKFYFISSFLLFSIIYLVYNYLRFGDFFNFGYGTNILGRWEEYAFDINLFPRTISSTFTQIKHVLSVFFNSQAYYPDDTSQLISFLTFEEDYLFHTLARPNYLALGIIPGLFIWIKNYKKHILELTIFTTIIFVTSFYLYQINGIPLRYLIDLWPAVYILSMKGFYDFFTFISNKFTNLYFFKYIIPCFFIFLLAESFVSKSSLEQNHNHFLVSGAYTSPTKYTGTHCSFLNIQDNLKCKDVTPLFHSTDSIVSYDAQASFRHLGINRVKNRCVMLFYSGVFLTLQKDKNCWIDLELKSNELTNCKQISLYYNHSRLGLMEKSKTKKEKIICRYALAPQVEEQAFFGFLIEPIQLQSKSINNIRGNLKNYTFYSVKATCHP